MTDDNELVWQGPTSQTFNFGAQTYKGVPVITYWNGTIFPEPIGHGYGTVHILNQSYHEIATVSLADNFTTMNGAHYPSGIDLHEIYITPNNTMLVTANNVTTTDLTTLGGLTMGYVVDGLVYEIDIATNEVLFRWSSLEHMSSLPLNLSVYPLGAEGFSGTNASVAWGYFHINAVSPLPGPDGGYLISSRYLCSAVAINRAGEVLWRLQGRDGGDFSLGPGTNFCFQHDIRAYPSPSSTDELILTMHNNANSPISNGTRPTAGLSLTLSFSNDSIPQNATLNQAYLNASDPVYSTAQGSYQSLPPSIDAQGHVLLGHGFVPKIREFDSNGDTVMTVQFADGVPGSTLSYRAFRQEWVGCPNSLPAVATAEEDGQVAVYMSWNGATQVGGWNVYSGSNQSSLSLVTTVAKSGFETRAAIANTSYVQVEPVASGSCRCDNLYGTVKSEVVAI